MLYSRNTLKKDRRGVGGESSFCVVGCVHTASTASAAALLSLRESFCQVYKRVEIAAVFLGERLQLEPSLGPPVLNSSFLIWAGSILWRLSSRINFFSDKMDHVDVLRNIGIEDGKDTTAVVSPLSPPRPTQPHQLKSIANLPGPPPSESGATLPASKRSTIDRTGTVSYGIRLSSLRDSIPHIVIEMVRYDRRKWYCDRRAIAAGLVFVFFLIVLASACTLGPSASASPGSRAVISSPARSKH